MFHRIASSSLGLGFGARHFDHSVLSICSSCFNFQFDHPTHYSKISPLSPAVNAITFFPSPSPSHSYIKSAIRKRSIDRSGPGAGPDTRTGIERLICKVKLRLRMSHAGLSWIPSILMRLLVSNLISNTNECISHLVVLLRYSLNPSLFISLSFYDRPFILSLVISFIHLARPQPIKH